MRETPHIIDTGHAVPTVEQAVLEARPLELDIDLSDAFESGNIPAHQNFSASSEHKAMTVAKVGPYLH